MKSFRYVVLLSLLAAALYSGRHAAQRVESISAAITDPSTPGRASSALPPRNRAPMPASAGTSRHAPAAPAAPATTAPALPAAILQMATVESRSTPVPAGSPLRRNVRLLRSGSKYPLWRVEELVETPSPTAPPRVASRIIAVADHVIVRTKPDIAPSTLASICSRHGAKIRKALHLRDHYLVAAGKADIDSLPRLIADLGRETSAILYAEPDHIVFATQTFPDDPSFPNLWGLHNTGQSGGTADADVDAPEAWDISQGSPDMVVGVIDSGVDMSHPDLASNIWTNPLESVNGLDDDGNGYVDDVTGWDFLYENNAPSDANSHGTHCAGTIAAAGNNGVGVAGMTWRCKIMPLRFLDAGGSGTTSDAIEALQYATDLRLRGIPVRLTSNSWGGGGDMALSEAIRVSGEAGMLFVAAAGNSGSNNDIQPFYPASYSWNNIVAVAATDRQDALAGFSCYGANSVDLAAPGVNIYSTVPGGYGTKDGTSMATPHVAGLAALLWSERPQASPAEIRAILFSTVDSLPALAGRTVTGGRINARKALEKLFQITHVPVGNRVNTGAPYPITANVSPAPLADTNQIWLYWNSDGSTNFTPVAMAATASNSFQALIPPQPEGSTVRYWLKAVSVSGGTALHPTNAPDAIHEFMLMPSVTLAVTGSPDNHGPVSPDYGLHHLPSNMHVEASAVWNTTPLAGTRWTCLGWSGTGDAPASGPSNSLTFTINQPSSIEWQWAREFGLDQTSLVAGIHSTTTWWQADSTAATIPAPESIARQGTNFIFGFWTLDDARQPNPFDPAVNPVQDIVMNTPHKAAAVYVPANLDTDADNLPDWWELRFFGSTNSAPGDDDDGDGSPNLDEYLDRTSPRRSDDKPVLPLILHTPLEDPMPHPAPFPMEAFVTDNFDVAQVRLSWTQSGSAVQTIPMEGTAGTNRYTATIPAPGTNGDVFVYWITASDPLGQTATNGPHTVHVSYPMLLLSPTAFSPVIRPDTTTNTPLLVSNLGSAIMEAMIQAIPAGYSNTFDTGGEDWTPRGAGGPWNLTTNRFLSPARAWYCGNPLTRRYTSSMHACLDSQPLYLGSNSVLSFDHWIQAELDTQSWRFGWKPNHAWDGGIVEISTNDGASFHQITPVGGYSHAISGWSRSPWPSETPCFAGSGGWSHATFDLAAFTRKMVILRFHFGSDNNTEQEGWYIDNVVVSPIIPTDPWLSWNPTQLSLAPGSATTATLSFAAGSLPTGDRDAALRVTCNDPVNPVAILPLRLRVRSQPVLSPLAASQTSTNGEGWVAIDTTLRDSDGDLCHLELEWSTNNSAWTRASIISAESAEGSALLNTSSTPQVAALLTSHAGAFITNWLSMIWDTSTNGNALGYSTEARVRARPVDEWMTGDWQTSAVFTVDNVPPPAVERFTNLTQSAGVWTAIPSMSLLWWRVPDIGVGLAGYRVTLSNDAPPVLLEYDTAATCLKITALPDGANWHVSLTPRDLRGNVGRAVTLGPYRIDSTPPSATAAVIRLETVPGGAFLLATGRVAGSWAGFSDSGSGISGYFCSLSSAQPGADSPWSPAPSNSLAGMQPDQTNVFHVWARDQVGWISAPASFPFLALSPGGDWDKDGMPNVAEGTAGTDPTDPASILRLRTTVNPDGTMTLTWPACSNRLYTLSWSGTLLPAYTNWIPMPHFVRMTGMDGWMMYRDPVRARPTRFYRLTVEQP